MCVCVCVRVSSGVGGGKSRKREISRGFFLKVGYEFLNLCFSCEEGFWILMGRKTALRSKRACF